MFEKRREMAESVRKTVSDASTLLRAVAAIAVSALLMAVGALFMVLRTKAA